MTEMEFHEDIFDAEKIPQPEKIDQVIQAYGSHLLENIKSAVINKWAGHYGKVRLDPIFLCFL